MYNDNDEKIWITEFTPGFRKLKDFLRYIEYLWERYDLRNWSYTWENKYQEPEFKLVIRSQFGHGSLFFSNQEYECENEFISTSDN